MVSYLDLEEKGCDVNVASHVIDLALYRATIWATHPALRGVGFYLSG